METQENLDLLITTLGDSGILTLENGTIIQGIITNIPQELDTYSLTLSATTINLITTVKTVIDNNITKGQTIVYTRVNRVYNLTTGTPIDDLTGLMSISCTLEYYSDV